MEAISNIQFKQPFWVIDQYNYQKRIMNELGIDHFYSFETGEKGTNIIVADGCVDIMFKCGKSPEASIWGATVKGVKGKYPPDSYFFGVRFMPGYYNSFGDCAMKDINNNMIQLQELIKENGYIEKITNSKNTKKQIDIFLEMFCNEGICKKTVCSESELFLQIRNTILDKEGRISVSEIAGDLCYSERRVSGIFKDYMGISIKKFSNIVRFQSMCK